MEHSARQPKKYTAYLRKKKQIEMYAEEVQGASNMYLAYLLSSRFSPFFQLSVTFCFCSFLGGGLSLTERERMKTEKRYFFFFSERDFFSTLESCHGSPDDEEHKASSSQSLRFASNRGHHRRGCATLQQQQAFTLP